MLLKLYIQAYIWIFFSFKVAITKGLILSILWTVCYKFPYWVGHMINL